MQLVFKALAGLFAGILGSLGMGGGAVLIIYLTAFLGVHQLTAQGINLLFFIPLALTAIIIHSKHSLIKWKKVVPIVLSGLVGTLVGVYISHHIDPGYLKKIFALLLLYVAYKELTAKKTNK